MKEQNRCFDIWYNPKHGVYYGVTAIDEFRRGADNFSLMFQYSIMEECPENGLRFVSKGYAHAYAAKWLELGFVKVARGIKDYYKNINHFIP